MRHRPECQAPRRRRFLVAGLAALPLLALAACGNAGGNSSAASTGSASSSSSGSGTYNVALISDLTGDFSSVSAPGAAGVEVAVNAINASGGVNGRKLNLTVLDSQSSPTVALTQAQKAIAGNPLALFMLSGSAGASAITSLAQSSKIPLLSPGLNDSSVYPAEPYLYQPSLTADQDAQAMYEFVKQQEKSLSGKVVDIAAINSPYVDVIIKDVSTLLTGQGARVSSPQRYNLPLASFATQASAIGRDKPNVVLVLGSTDDSVVVSKALSAAGVAALQVGIPSGAAQSTLQQIGSSRYYGLSANPYPSETPAFEAAANTDDKTSDVAGSLFAMSGWTAVYMLADALKQCGANCTASSVNTALQHVSNMTVPDGVSYGPVTFSTSNHVAVGTVRFRSYDPATGKFLESIPIGV